MGRWHGGDAGGLPCSQNSDAAATQAMTLLSPLWRHHPPCGSVQDAVSWPYLWRLARACSSPIFCRHGTDCSIERWRGWKGTARTRRQRATTASPLYDSLLILWWDLGERGPIHHTCGLLWGRLTIGSWPNLTIFPEDITKQRHDCEQYLWWPV